VDVVSELEPNGASTSIRRPRFRGAVPKAQVASEIHLRVVVSQTTKHKHGIGRFRGLLGRF
jgi:hypothetical protein